MNKAALYIFAGLSAASSCLFSGPVFSAPSAASVAPNAVTLPVQKLYSALQRIQTTKGSSFTQRQSMLAPVIPQVFDLPTILQTSVGYKYDSFSPTDRNRLLTTFQQFTTARYVSSFSPDDSGTKFTIQPGIMPSSVGNGQIVKTKIDDTQINYLLHQTAQGWKIIDVLVDGHVSQVAIQHGDFKSAIDNGGVDTLISDLNKKINQFSRD